MVKSFEFVPQPHFSYLFNALLETSVFQFIIKEKGVKPVHHENMKISHYGKSIF